MPFHVSDGENTRKVVKPGKDFSIGLGGKSIATLVVTEKDPDEIHVKVLDPKRVMVKSGFGFKHFANSEVVKKKKGCLIYDHETNITIIVDYVEQSMALGDTDKEIIVE